MKLLSVLLSVAGVSSLAWVCPVFAETGRQEDRKIGRFAAADLIAQGVTRVTGVEVIQTESGLELVLETVAGSERLVPLIVPEGNDLVIDVLDATLAFSIRNGVTELNPAPGISRVSVNEADENSIQVRITGENQTPRAEIVTGRENLVLSITPDGTTAEEAPDEEIEVIATGEAEDDDYDVDRATTATRTVTPLRDIPQSIQVVPQQVIKDRNTETIIESTETVSGVVYNGGFADAPTGSVIIRGFSQAQQFRNGFRDTDRAGLSAIGTTDRVEILKGPGSVLFGNLEPGGIINVVTKQPLREPFYELSFEAGNRSFFQPGVDLSGPLTEDKSVLYRLIANYQTSDSFQEFAESDITTVAPSLAFNIGEETKLSLNYEYINYDGDPPEDYSFLLSDGSKPSRDFYLGYPDFSFRDFTTQKFGYTFSHEFSDRWQLRNNFSAAITDTEEAFIEPLALTDDSVLELGAAEGEFTNDNYYGNIDVLGEFNTGAVSHQVLFGFDVNRLENGFARDTAAVPNLNIQNPNYDVPRPDNFALAFDNDDFVTSYGIYLQDQVDLLDNVKLLVGGRFDWISLRTEEEGVEIDDQDDSAFSPRVGLVYQPSEQVALYTSFSRSFVQEAGFSLDGETFEPTRGTQYEIGVKTDFLEDKLSTTLAAYYIEKTNVTTPDPIDPDFSIQTGEQRSQGIELDINGEILPGWKVTAAYSLTDAEVTEDNSIPEGNRLTNVPENQASIWTTYELQKGSLKGLGFGLGLFYIGEREGDLDNSFQLDDYLRTDAALYYRRDRLNAAINFRNLFDADYFRASDGGELFLFRGEPFTVVGSVSWEF
ncbi:TonB-dependent siderophore receptor [Pleurocapsa sp. CCALA 161]|uniref:TonB-dependent siderophore receptor n=1 Tax=Pleurocapsa sp. CCALA 161 TaxID=2107688 RepID=UPI000D07173B|nr:TonB-dependent siderophore receptor [Pleurocapsa sp. CCALA 161]PSB09502.1 TonB-dependent siderophore receptor [Pleurocapsa sp. CCALA 161]